MLAFARQGIERYENATWDALAYAARYGHQDIGTVEHWTMRRLTKLNAALGKIVEQENKPGPKGR